MNARIQNIIDTTVKQAGDNDAVLLVLENGNKIMSVGHDGEILGTPYGNDLDAAINEYGNGMIGVYVISSFYDNDEGKWDAEVEYFESGVDY